MTTRYIVHDAVAHEVDEDTFFRVKESGGTRISSAYKKLLDVIARDFPVSDWNIYCFQFSDGDNWGEDNRECSRLLIEQILPISNLFCYGQVGEPVRFRRLYPGTAADRGSAREPDPERDPLQGGDLRLDQDVSRPRQMTNGFAHMLSLLGGLVLLIGEALPGLRKRRPSRPLRRSSPSPKSGPLRTTSTW